MPGFSSALVDGIPFLHTTSCYGRLGCVPFYQKKEHISVGSPKSLVFAHFLKALLKHCSPARVVTSEKTSLPDRISQEFTSTPLHFWQLGTATLAACLWSVQFFAVPIDFQCSAPLFWIKITSKTQNRLIHMWTLSKMSSEGANACLMFLWTHCCPFTCIYFGWPMAEPWKLENKLLFSQSCQRWLLCWRVGCGTNAPRSAASSAALLSPQLHTCLQKPSVYLVCVGSPDGAINLGRWEGCSADTRTMAAVQEKETAPCKPTPWSTGLPPSSCPGPVSQMGKWHRAPWATTGPGGCKMPCAHKLGATSQ